MRCRQEIFDINGLSWKIDYNAKITEIKSKIPSSSGFATTPAYTTVENKIPDVSNAVKKTDYDAEILNLNILLQLIIINLQRKKLT